MRFFWDLVLVKRKDINYFCEVLGLKDLECKYFRFVFVDFVYLEFIFSIILFNRYIEYIGGVRFLLGR